MLDVSQDATAVKKERADYIDRLHCSTQNPRLSLQLQALLQICVSCTLGAMRLRLWCATRRLTLCSRVIVRMSPKSGIILPSVHKNLITIDSKISTGRYFDTIFSTPHTAPVDVCRVLCRCSTHYLSAELLCSSSAGVNRRVWVCASPEAYSV